jgi:hypothetical protein
MSVRRLTVSIPKFPSFKQGILDCLLGRWGGKYEDELCILWYTREDVQEWQEITLTDDEWEEITGRFNEMDWQYMSEEIDELVRQVMDRRDEPCEA